MVLSKSTKVGIFLFGFALILQSAAVIAIFQQENRLMATFRIYSFIFLLVSLLFIGLSIPSEMLKRIKWGTLLLIVFLAFYSLWGANNFLYNWDINLYLASILLLFAYTPMHIRASYLKLKQLHVNRFEKLLLSTLNYFALLFFVMAINIVIVNLPDFAENFFIIAIVLALISAFYTNKKFISEIFKRKQAEEKIRLQHQELVQKSNEIAESIAYAKRIQLAILPPLELIKSAIPQSFVLYEAKDVVAGDFYWFHNQVEDGSVLIAAADCTGHGVPGAMVSVICNSSLNRTVNEFKLSKPGDILSKTRELVIQEFEKSNQEVKDGMDIALCSINGNTIQYAGAYNPFWLIRKDSEVVEEVKAHKEAIGLVENPKPFPTHAISLAKGDTFYLFSDGYVDQFGGPAGKKFKSSQFKKLLLEIQKDGMEKQAQILKERFMLWKGDEEQVDDVCVIGVRL